MESNAAVTLHFEDFARGHKLLVFFMCVFVDDKFKIVSLSTLDQCEVFLLIYFVD